MKSVSRLTYTFWSFFYHSLCLSGLIWQVTLISKNFFEFDVNTDVKIRMPREFDYKVGTSVYLCFEIDEFLNQEKFRDLMLVWSKSNHTDKQDFADRWRRGRGVSYSFRLATVGEIFQFVLNESIINQSGIIEFLFMNKTCFTSNKTSLESIFFGDDYYQRQTQCVNRVLDKVNWISAAIGENYPYFDPISLVRIRNIHKVEILDLHSYSCNRIKKEFPYSDKCYDYRSSKFVNQYEAKQACYEKSLGNKVVSSERIISKSDFHFYNSTRKYGRNRDCDELPPDCNRTVHLSSFEKYMRDANFSDLKVSIWPVRGKEPSFTLVSKPRIDNIDYVTYVLGALGSWLGFSFLGINPVPHLLTVANNQVEGLSNRSLSNRVARIETRCNKSKQELKIDLESAKQQNQRLSRSINIHGYMIRKLMAEMNSLKQNQDA